MPTGYTDPVRSGEITTLKEFGLLCARAFGATILMRDEPLDAKIPDAFEPSDYHKKALSQALRRRDAVAAMPESECEIAAAKEHAETCEHRARMRAKRDEEKARYEAMLTQVEALEVPESHAEFKNYMRSQLTESIKFDCGSYYDGDPEKPTGAEWRTKEIEAAEQDIDYHARKHAEEVERVRGRNEWIATLRTILAQGEASPALTE